MQITVYSVMSQCNCSLLVLHIARVSLVLLFFAGTFESSPLSSKDLPKAVLESLVSEDDLRKMYKQPSGSQNASNVNMTAITMAALKSVENNTHVAYYPPSPSGMS